MAMVLVLKGDVSQVPKLSKPAQSSEPRWETGVIRPVLNCVLFDSKIRDCGACCWSSRDVSFSPSAPTYGAAVGSGEADVDLGGDNEEREDGGDLKAGIRFRPAWCDDDGLVNLGRPERSCAERRSERAVIRSTYCHTYG
jgi:hypothetical protein